MKTGTVLVTTLFTLASFPLLAQQPPPAGQPNRPGTQQNTPGTEPGPQNSVRRQVSSSPSQAITSSRQCLFGS
jgi:hypothetical protein